VSQLPVHIQRIAKILPHGLDRLYEPADCNHSALSPGRETANTDLENSNRVFIYSSAPNRGLQDVLIYWGRIHEALPDAVLEVYYGFGAASDNQLRFNTHCHCYCYCYYYCIMTKLYS
jgi:hypothetical protein